jgi:hypothetical protein
MLSEKDMTDLIPHGCGLLEKLTQHLSDSSVLLETGTKILTLYHAPTNIPEIDDGKICRRLFIWQKPLLPTEFLLNPWQCTQLRSVRVASYLYALSRVQESAERKHSLRHLGYRGRWANPMGFHPLES